MFTSCGTEYRLEHLKQDGFALTAASMNVLESHTSKRIG